MRLFARPRQFILGALLVLGAGCSQSKSPLQPVHGTVFYQNSAITHGRVVFTPDASRGHSGPIASSEISPDGTYFLQTDNAPGAAAGWYRVTVAAIEMPAQPEAGDRFAVPHSLLPDRYRDPELADLVRQVVPGRANSIDFHLD